MDRIFVLQAGWNWDEMYLWLLPSDIIPYPGRNFTSMPSGNVEVQNLSLGGHSPKSASYCGKFESIIAYYFSISTDCFNNPVQPL